MLKTLLTIVCLLLAAGNALAEDVLLVTAGAAPGKYILTLGADGRVTSIVPLGQVISLNGQPTPPPIDPQPGPAPHPFESEVERITKASLAAGGTPTTGAAISSAYSFVADGIANGTITTARALEAIKAATTLVLSKQSDAAAWQTWRTSLGDALTTLRDQGSLSTQEQYVTTFRQIVNGIGRATGFTGDPAEILRLAKVVHFDLKQLNRPVLGILDNINFEQLMALIKLIVELLKLFQGGGL
jgi:hypothetical protein